jgi:hypothetical protein
MNTLLPLLAVIEPVAGGLLHALIYFVIAFLVLFAIYYATTRFAPEL